MTKQSWIVILFYTCYGPILLLTCNQIQCLNDTADNDVEAVQIRSYHLDLAHSSGTCFLYNTPDIWSYTCMSFTLWEVAFPVLVCAAFESLAMRTLHCSIHAKISENPPKNVLKWAVLCKCKRTVSTSRFISPADSKHKSFSLWHRAGFMSPVQQWLSYNVTYVLALCMSARKRGDVLLVT